MNIRDIIDSSINSNSVNINRTIVKINDNIASIIKKNAKIKKKTIKNMIRVCIKSINFRLNCRIYRCESVSFPLHMCIKR